MLKNKHLWLVAILLLFTNVLLAQTRTITGKVTSGANEAQPGASVLIKETLKGTVVDANGRYTIVAPNSDVTLIISSIGYDKVERKIGPNVSEVNFVLTESTGNLSEVVVTALGISREKKTLVYATQTVKPTELVEARDPNNIINSLSGKIANATITQGSGGPGSGARIILRGNRSIQGSNNALIVVDGVPLNNGTNGTVGSDFGDVQGSDGASNINPDDIESLTVLRGASAAALYGSQAGNGVIVITTKKGKSGKMSVLLNSGFSTETVTSLPNFQNTYGATLTPDGKKMASGLSWGPKMTGQSVLNTEGKSVTYSPQPNNVSDFFRQGSSFNNSIGITGGTDKMQTYFSYANTQQKGIISRNDLNRNTVNLRVSNQLSSKFSTDAKITYVTHEIVNRPRTGENNAPVLNIYNMPRSLSSAEAQNYEKINNIGIATPTPFPSTLSSIYENPYWTVNKQGTNESRDRVIGFITAKYKFLDWLTLSGKANLDKTVDRGENYIALGTLFSPPGGGYGKSFITKTDKWFDAMLEGNNTITSDLKVNYRVGGIFQDTQYDATFSNAGGLNVTNKYSLNFGKSPSSNSDFSEIQTQSVFGQANFSFKDAIFLDASVRNDWNSTLPAPHSFLYPSIGVSTVLSDLLKISDKLTFLKASINYAQVGNGGQFALLQSVYSYGQGAGNGFLQIGSTLPLPGLKPEIVKNLEFGLEARFLKNRLGFTATYYKSNSSNQLLKIRLPVASGFNDKYINAGDIQNKGFEFVMTGAPVQNDNFKWDVTLNFALNRNKVITLSEDLKITNIGGNDFGRSATPIIKEGGSFGELIATKWARDAQGRKLVDANGVPVITKDQEYIGNFNPKATVGFTNTFDYKAFSLRVLVDGRIGGVIVSGTEMNLAFNGIPKVTEAFREGGLNLGGVNDKGETITKTITAQQFWQKASGGRYGNGEFFAYDATNIRVRELSAGYRIPLKSAGAIKGAKISLVGRNLLWIYRGKSILDIPGIGKRTMAFDPDMALSNSNWQGVEYGTMPATRSMGINLQVTF
jgi:TonB-linked SusC/RagA family outer membrane protein